jgi:hypothetical protein
MARGNVNGITMKYEMVETLLVEKDDENVSFECVKTRQF